MKPIPAMKPEFDIKSIATGRKRYLDLLLMGDEQESMIDRYLMCGDMYVAFAGAEAVGVCVVTREADNLMEIKNLAVSPDRRRTGIGNSLLRFIENRYKDCDIQLGTGATPSTVRFYESAGYRYSHRIKDFFSINYDHPIVEEGVQLTDMLYFVKRKSDKTV